MATIKLPPPTKRAKSTPKRILLTLDQAIYARVEKLADSRGEPPTTTIRVLVLAALDAVAPEG